jgi:MFS transporter, FHS family, L-fucose permease
MSTEKKSVVIPMIIVGFMFAVLGFALGINAFFIPFVKSAFHISTTMSYFVMTATFSAFIIFGVPSGIIITKLGYKGGIVVAFLLMAAGFFTIAPASASVSFPLFLLALFINGMGQTILNAAVNTYISILGNPESAITRISIMGICNKFAYAAASFILAIFIHLSDIQLKDTVIPFYIISGIMIIMGVLSYFAPLPEVKATGEDDSDDKSFASVYDKSKTSVFQFPHLFLGIIALFFDVGLETIGLGTINDYASILKLPSPENYIWLTSAGMILGYLFGVAFTPKIISQVNALKLFTLIGIAATIAILAFPEGVSIYLVAVLGLANSLLMPAIWPLAIADLGKFTKTGSSLLVMGIFGGAVLPLCFGYFADVFSYHAAYLVCLPAYLFILYFGVSGYKIRDGHIKY